MSVGAVVLAANQSFVGSSIGGSVAGLGGRAAFVCNAAAYGANGLFLQLQGPSGAWINMNSSAFTADSSFIFDSPPGQYRVVCNASSVISLYAVLTNLQY